MKIAIRIDYIGAREHQKAKVKVDVPLIKKKRYFNINPAYDNIWQQVVYLFTEENIPIDAICEYNTGYILIIEMEYKNKLMEFMS